jgi:hypothetical protein
LNDNGGDDVTGDGSVGNPWLTLHRAINNNIGLSTDDIIYVFNGVYAESQQIILPLTITIRGQSEAGVIITPTFVGSANEPLIKLETSNGWLGTYGNQSISYLTINGNNVGNACIRVNYRSNVSISHVTIKDFLRNGIIFYGMPMSSWTAVSVFEPDRTMPNYWCTGNSITYCTITNCIQGIGDDGQIRMGQQNGMVIAYNYTRQPIIGAGSNCGGIKFQDDGYNKNSDIHDNTIIVDLNPNNHYNFAIEMWYELGGCKYYNNQITGSLDIDCAIKGTSQYSVWINHNTIGYSSYQRYNHYGINLEGNNTDVIIEKNVVQYTHQAILLSHIWPNSGSGRDAHPLNNVMTNVRISCNLFINCGFASNAATGDNWEPVYGINLGGQNDGYPATATMNNFEISNNVIAGGSVADGTYYMVGIWLPSSNMIVNGLHIRNNIITGFIGGDVYSAPIFGTGLYGSGSTIINLNIQKNIFYGNGNSNATLFVSNYAGYVGAHTYDTPITSNPLFEGGSPYSYELQSLSPAIHSGMDVGLDLDYAGNYFFNPNPSMGALEYQSKGPELPSLTTTSITSITETTAFSGGNISDDGGESVTARGVCWSTLTNPTVSSPHTTNGIGTGIFTSSVTPLDPNTTYYIRAYATNSIGPAYGNIRSFTTLPVGSEIVTGDLLKYQNNLIKVGNIWIKIE